MMISRAKQRVRMTVTASAFIKLFGRTAMTVQSEPLEGRRAHDEAAHRVQAELEAYWAEMLSDGEERERVAALLGVPSKNLDKLQHAPVRVQPSQSNAGAAEIGLIVVTWLASEVVLDLFKDILQEEIKSRVKQVWAHVSRRIDERMEGGKATGWPAELPPGDSAGTADSKDKSRVDG